MAGLDSSPGSIDDIDDADARDDKKRQPVKRACNECRQQKLRCDVIQDPFEACSRCRRLKLDCKIESNFKRVGKRSRNAEMEREIIELRKQVANVQANAAAPIPQQQPLQPAPLAPRHDPSQASQTGAYHTPAMSADQIGSHEAVVSLLDLRFDGSNSMRNGNHQFKRIEDVMLSNERAAELFDL
ncbi:Transcription factor [Aspergillus sp. HF37]|nr:Transcription factor [Aspergillus sp. HF37]